MANTPAAVLRAGQRVATTDGEVGRVDTVLIDSATKRATHFTVRKGLLLHKDVIVPVEWIADYQPDLIKLGVDKTTLEHLPPYHSDQELEWEVEDALWTDTALVEGLLHETTISVLVRDGVVTLGGYVRSVVQKQYAEKVAANVPGVLGVRNHLVADDELEQAVSEALDADPRTRDLPIHVDAWIGYVHLTGDVPTKEIKAAAQQIAAGVPGVRNAINMLAVAGIPSPLEQERLRELNTGQLVYANDTTIGSVEKLLIDPQTWRISAIVVRMTVSGRHDTKSGRTQAGEAVVVPVEHVENVTVGAVYLSLSKDDVQRLPRFDPADYPAPDRNWQPPTPYRREDIRFDHLASNATSSSFA
jgi:osmotically-inducible protein OsmY/sporulation protein YlmC with PRC-barrel domain